MKTQFITPEPYASEALRLARETTAVNSIRPTHFQKVMRENRGTIGSINPFGSGEDGLERRNPLIAALGDSVTAGHFENAIPLKELLEKIAAESFKEDEVGEITDPRVCYLEQFRSMLIDRFEQTSVSAINSGIAGDTLYGMQRRLYRDVIRYQPDLVLLNGVLNWNEACGNTEDYRKVLIQIIRAIRSETKADLVLMTPNMDYPSPLAPGNPLSSLKERVEVIRTLAEQEQICLADTYKVWEAYEAAGYPVQKLLANGLNHPSVTGHTLYALVLMQLMDEPGPLTK